MGTIIENDKQKTLDELVFNDVVMLHYPGTGTKEYKVVKVNPANKRLIISRERQSDGMRYVGQWIDSIMTYDEMEECLWAYVGEYKTKEELVANNQKKNALKRKKYLEQHPSFWARAKNLLFESSEDEEESCSSE